MYPNTALSIDSDCEPLENVTDMSSTFVMLYFAIDPASRAVLCYEIRRVRSDALD